MPGFRKLGARFQMLGQSLRVVWLSCRLIVCCWPSNAVSRYAAKRLGRGTMHDPKRPVGCGFRQTMRADIVVPRDFLLPFPPKT